MTENTTMIENYKGKGQKRTYWGRACKHCEFHTFDETYGKEIPKDETERKKYIKAEDALLR